MMTNAKRKIISRFAVALLAANAALLAANTAPAAEAQNLPARSGTPVMEAASGQTTAPVTNAMPRAALRQRIRGRLQEAREKNGRPWAGPDDFNNNPPDRNWRGNPAYGPPERHDAPGGGPAADFFSAPDRLLRADEQLQDLRQEFERLESRRAALLGQLDKIRAAERAGNFSPSTLLDRQNADQALGELHEIAERQRQLCERATRILRLAIVSRRFWMPMAGLEDEKNSMTLTAIPLPPRIARAMAERADEFKNALAARQEVSTRWQAAGKALQEQNPAACAAALLGARFGAIVIQYADTQPEGPGLAEMLRPAGQRPGALIRLGEAGRDRLLQRLDRLEDRLNRLNAEAEEQRQEIRRLRETLKQIRPADQNNAAGRDHEAERGDDRRDAQ